MADTVPQTTRAWLLDFGRGLKAAVGIHEMVHVLLEFELHEVPCTPLYCNEVIFWEKRILPILDMATLLEGQRAVHSKDILGIALYQLEADKPLELGGLHLVNTPTAIHVKDEDACELPSYQEVWRPLAISCFDYEGTAIPVLDLAYLFSGEYHGAFLSY